jgi:hypothetical protein
VLLTANIKAPVATATPAPTIAATFVPTRAVFGLLVDRFTPRSVIT